MTTSDSAGSAGKTGTAGAIDTALRAVSAPIAPAPGASPETAPGAASTGSENSRHSSPTTATTPTSWLRSVLSSFSTSKKFLVGLAAALVAVVRGIASGAGADVDQAALDRVFLALLAYVGVQGLADAGKTAQQIRTGAVVASLESTLGELVRSKTFLASASAAIVAIAGPIAARLGIQLDAASLDRVFLAILAYVGAQGIANAGEGAARAASGGATVGTTTLPLGTGDLPRGPTAPSQTSTQNHAGDHP